MCYIMLCASYASLRFFVKHLLVMVELIYLKASFPSQLAIHVHDYLNATTASCLSSQ